MLCIPKDTVIEKATLNSNEKGLTVSSYRALRELQIRWSLDV